jgi:hypothetical protein
MIVLHQAGREWLSPTLLRALSGRQRRAIARRDTHKFESRYLDWLVRLGQDPSNPRPK